MAETIWIKTNGVVHPYQLRTTGGIRAAARALRRSLPRPYFQREREAWQRTIDSEVSTQVRKGGTATEVYDFAMVTAVQLVGWEVRRVVANTIMAGDFWNTNREHDPADYRYGDPIVSTTGLKGIPGTPEFSRSVAVWYKRRLRHLYVDSLVPAFAERKKEGEGQRWLEGFLKEIPPELVPLAPRVNWGDGDAEVGPVLAERHVSQDQIDHLQQLIQDYANERGRPRVANPSAATLRKRRQRQRQREGKRMLDELQADLAKAEAAAEKFGATQRINQQISQQQWLDVVAKYATVGRKVAELCQAVGMEDRADILNEHLERIT